jgi:hypothetical protein
MRDIYCNAVARAGMLPENPGELDQLFAACEIHKTMYRLARSANWGLAGETVTAWCAQVARLAKQI